MAHRYYTNAIQGDEARVTGGDAAHLARVLRVRVGEALVLCDGANTDYDAVVKSVSPDEVVLDITARRPSVAEPSLWAEVYLGYSKGDKLETAIQKCVELGASYIQPFFSANCVVKPKKEEGKNARYNRIAAEAAKQCGRGILPQVGMATDFKGMLARAGQCETALFLYEKGGKALRTCVPESGRVAIITGAEGGFTPEEASLAGAGGCMTIGLGPRILRCETAPVATLAALMALSGNLE